jgi:hypothetical protein
MKRIFHKAKNFKDAEDWDIRQHLQMTAEERQEVAKELRERVYGKKTIDLEDLKYLKKAMDKKGGS